jgi:hypothetical protein
MDRFPFKNQSCARQMFPGLKPQVRWEQSDLAKQTGLEKSHARNGILAIGNYGRFRL